MRNIFLEKSCTKCDIEIIPRPFSKKSKLSISISRQSIVCSYCKCQGDDYWNIQDWGWGI